MFSHQIRLAFLGLVIVGLCSVPAFAQPCQTPLLPLQPGMTVSTVSSALPGGVNPYVVFVHDVRDPAVNAPGLDTNWFADHDNNQSGVAWTNSVLGEVFGVCLDDAAAPNIYVGATTIYSTQGTGSGGYGAVYRIDGVSGAVCLAVDLPQSNPADGAGLGNLCFDRTNNQFFVANLDNGLIYRFNSLDCGTSVQSATTFDHGRDGRPDEGLTVISDNSVLKHTQLGRRVFAVQKHPTENRLYYSVSWEVGGNSSNPSEDNEIWSIELDAATGDFVLGTARREIILPSTANGVQPVVTDIDFSPLTCDMALAERSMFGLQTSAHASNVRVYTGNTAGWAPAACSVLRVGDYSVGDNSAGGISHDCDGNLWATGDALHFNTGDRIYGMQRIDLADNCSDATGSSNAYLVDFDCEINFADKTLLGDVELYRPDCPACGDDQSCMTIEPNIECSADGAYNVTLTITNNSGVDAERIRLLPLGGYSFSPSVFLGTVPAGTSTTINTTLTGVLAGEVICFEVWLLDANLQQCCVEEVCIEIPNCCLDFRVISIDCRPDGTFALTFEVINESAIPVDRIFLWPLTPAGYTFTPDNFLFGTPLGMGQSTGALSTVISGANPGDVICFDVTIHDSNTGDCCGDKINLLLPDCNPCDEPAHCDLPPVVSLCPDPLTQALVANFTATICNLCDQQEVIYEVFFDSVPGCGNVPFDSSWFNPSGFGTNPLPPGECEDRLITISIPPGIFAPGDCMCFSMVLVNTNTGEATRCESRVCLPEQQIKVVGPVDPIDIQFGEQATLDFQIESTGQAVAFDYELRLYIPGTAPGPQNLSLNGLPPGAPVTGSLDLPPGGGASLSTSLRVLDHEPFVFYDIILMVSPPGAGEINPVASFPVRSVNFTDCDLDGVSDDIAIYVGLVSDNNNNGIPDNCEGIPLFAAYLRGDSDHDSSFDINDPIHLMRYLYSDGNPAAVLGSVRLRR